MAGRISVVAAEETRDDETLYLGPKLPALIQWFASPLVNSVPAEIERDLLVQTRRALDGPAPAAR